MRSKFFLKKIDKSKFISYICCYIQLNKNYTNKKMTTVIIIGIISGLVWVWLRTNEDWNNMTKPPKGWRQKINKP